jgi:hypothetical protein
MLVCKQTGKQTNKQECLQALIPSPPLPAKVPSPAGEQATLWGRSVLETVDGKGGGDVQWLQDGAIPSIGPREKNTHKVIKQACLQACKHVYKHACASQNCRGNQL